MKNRFEPRRYLGLEVSGAKNDKTTLAILDHYPREKKVFLVDLLVNIGAGDGVLLETIRESAPPGVTIAVNVPLTLPPCLPCSRKTCSSPQKCTVPAVKWMREATQKAARRNPAVREFTSYTQRPIELWLKHWVLPEIPARFHFEVDETMGGNRAPLAARMAYLSKHLKKYRILETLPKLTLAILAAQLGFDPRLVENYRRMEEGAHARQKLLERLSEKFGLFIYEKDIRILSDSLGAFDAFLCVLTAVLKDTDRCAKIPQGFPRSSGWIEYPGRNIK